MASTVQTDALKKPRPAHNPSEQCALLQVWCTRRQSDKQTKSETLQPVGKELKEHITSDNKELDLFLHVSTEGSHHGPCWDRVQPLRAIASWHQARWTEAHISPGNAVGLIQQLDQTCEGMQTGHTIWQFGAVFLVSGKRCKVNDQWGEWFQMKDACHPCIWCPFSKVGCPSC